MPPAASPSPTRASPPSWTRRSSSSRPVAEPRTPVAAHPGRNWARVRRTGLPYLLLLPAVVFELLVHVVPMLTGIFMSFKHLTEFFIRNWGAAPAAGWDNYRFALDFNGAIGRQLLQSFWTTCAFTVLTV